MPNRACHALKMDSAFQIQKALYLFQRKQLSLRLQSPSPYFKRYAQRYARASSRVLKKSNWAQLLGACLDRDVVLVGDYHTHRSAQETFLSICQALHQMTHRKLVLALEFIEVRHQKTLDDFLALKISEQTFLRRIGHPYSGVFSVWPHFKPIFDFARKHHIHILAIDSRSTAIDSLQIRDAKAAKQINKFTHDQHLVLCLIGQFHIAPAHLPLELQKADQTSGVISVFQNPEGAYFELLKSNKTVPLCVELSKHAFGIFPSTPVACQRSFLDYVEAEGAVLEERSLEQTVRHLVRQIGQAAGFRIPKTQTDQLLVTTSSDPQALEKIMRRAVFSASEKRKLKALLSTRESLFVPKARAVHLSSLTLDHAAEEAAHCVRFLAIKKDMNKPRTIKAAFFHRCLEESLAYLGLRLVNGKNRSQSVADQQMQFEQSTGSARAAAATVIAIVASAKMNQAIPNSILPLGSERQFHAVSHALGYMLGEMLFERWTNKTLSQAAIRALFLDVFREPEKQFCEFFQQKEMKRLVK